ncbi:hypothetical protein HPB51_012945 [Rhipicephalus microplus]|uniref:Gamma-aminobutyric acid type B receptor subunit 2 n=1 Tax=Rhipicephalus microplus TaxID=6941 RepID=A0A9J6F2J9_RHIMP|nr:hypothetical protein HPB51_012945 [Rhipicephalus microplus]
MQAGCTSNLISPLKRQISFGSLSSVLSDRAGFPLFFRTVAPDSSHNAARVAFLRRYRWDTVATLHEDDELYALAINELLTQLESAHIAVSSSESVTRNDFLEQIQELKNTDSRIIIGSFSRHMARKIFCEVYKQGMYGADFQWIVQGGLGEWWLDPSGTDCLAGQLRAAAENIITVAAYTGSLPNRASVSGLVRTRCVGDRLCLGPPRRRSRVRSRLRQSHFD